MPTILDAGPKGQATVRQQRVLDFMREFLAENSVPPTIREIAERFALASPNGAMCYLRALEKKGLVLHKFTGRSRGWVPVSADGVCPACGQKLPRQSV